MSTDHDGRPNREQNADDRSAEFPVGAKVTVESLTDDPLPVLRELRAAEPVSWVPHLGAWLVTSRDLALEVMRDADRFTVDDPRFTTAAILGDSMLSLDGPEHHRHRTPFAPAFRPGILRDQFDDFLHQQVAALINLLDPAGADLRTGLAGPLAVNTITRFLGLDGVTAADVLGWYTSIAAAITDLTVTGVVDPGDRRAVAEVHERVEATLASGDTASLLASIKASGALRPEEMGSAAVVLMFGAIETAEGMTSNALWHLLTTPDAWRSIADDPSLLPNAIEESLRLEPAASFIDRYSTVKAELGGVTIPERELVRVSLLAANHDPADFTNPARYDLGRHNARQHLSFVQGPHACLGLHLARMETTAAIEGLLERAPHLTIDPERSTPPSGFIFRKPGSLWARLH